MGRTFNRSPLSVDVPSASDVKQYYFNHYNWKGINQNKNFLLVDQETFADALNVYVDDKNLLKSRPALKLAYEWSGREIVDIKVFDDIFLIEYKAKGQNYISFVDANAVLATRGPINFPVRCFRNNSMIYVFTNGFTDQPGGPSPQPYRSMLQFDMVSKKLSYADAYNPVTRIYTGNRYVEYESENLFSNYSKYRYVLFPSIVSKDYVHDSISSNAYGKDCTYSHSINEEIITHDVYIDSNGDFLGKIHQTLSYDSNNYHITNVYGVDVPTYFIKDDIVYRFNDGRVEKAPTSTMIFETIFKENKFDKANFVKIKPQDAGYMTVIYKDGIRRINYDGTDPMDEKGVDISMSNLLYLKYYIDVAEIRMTIDGNTHLVWVGIGFNEHRESNETSKSTCSGVQLYDGFDKDGDVQYKFLRLSNWHDNDKENIFQNIRCSGEIDIGYNESSYVESQGFSLSYASDFSYFEDVVYCHGSLFLISIKSLYGKISIAQSDTYFTSSYYVYDEKNPDTYPNLAQGKLLNTIDIKFAEYKTIVTASLLVNKSYQKQERSQFSILHYGVLNLTSDLTFSNSLETSSDVQYYYNDTLYFLKDDKFYYYYKDNKSELITDLKGIPVLNSYSNYWLYLVPEKNVVLSNYKFESINVDTLIKKDNQYNGIDLLFKDSEIYVSKGCDLFIGNVVTDESENESLYFRKIDKNTFDTDINGIWKISDNLIGLFFDDSTKYCSKSEGVYYFVDSKIVPRLKGKSSLITLKDSTTTLLPSNDGVYSLSYQDFVNTTEQSTKNISEDVSDLYLLFKDDVRMINYKNYTMFYENQNKNVLIFDLRYSGWWLWKVPVNITNLFFNDDILFIIGDGKVYQFIETSENYFDFVGDKIKIDWHVQSQKLHLNANNYYKHIYNITLYSVDDNSTIAMRLDVNNYRKYVDSGKKETFKYFIDVLRTFVKRLNYSKVCEFQYTLASDTKDGGNAINFPLSLSNITVKYDIGGQVR